MKKYKAIIYDIDGTVLDTIKMNMFSLIKIIKEELGEDWSFEKVMKFGSYRGMDVMEELHIKDKEETYFRWVQYVNEYEEGATLYEGFYEVFEQFRIANITQAIVTSKSKEQYKLDVVSKGIDKFMAVTVLAEDTKKHKPNPEPLIECLKRLHMNADEVLYIGDALSDYEATKNAHIDFGYATWGSVSNKGIENPTFIFNHPLEILQLLH